MQLIKSVHIQCQRCGARFAPPEQIRDLAMLEEFAAWGGIVDCVQCHHFIEVGRNNLSFMDAAGCTQSLRLTPFRDSRKNPTAEDSAR
jgi:hypothetical protein